MNRLNFILRRAPVAAVLLTAILVMPAVHAQSAAGTVDNRFLFIYGTSADMKNRVPALQTEMNNLLVHSLATNCARATALVSGLLTRICTRVNTLFNDGTRRKRATFHPISTGL